MNARFFDVKKSKQDAIINAALKIFAENGYKNASTDIIVKEAGISKGLLFHYFISKPGLYGFIFDYSVKYMTLELTRAVNKTTKDFFEVQVQIERAKGRVLRQYPYMQQFLYGAQYENNSEAIAAISEEKDALTRMYNSLYSQTDNTKFLDKVDINRVIDLIRWMSDGLARDKYLAGDFAFEEMISEIETYLNMLRRHFYRSVDNDQITIAMEETGERDDSVMEQFRMEMTFEERLEAGKRPLVELPEEEEDKAEEPVEDAGETETADTTAEETETNEVTETVSEEAVETTNNSDGVVPDDLDDDKSEEDDFASTSEVSVGDATVEISTGNVELKLPSFDEVEEDSDKEDAIEEIEDGTEENVSDVTEQGETDATPEIKLPSWWTNGNEEENLSVPVMSIPQEVLHTTLANDEDEDDEEEEDIPWTPRPVKQIKL